MKVLIIQILRLGDALQLTPIAKSLKVLFPEACISIITSSLGKEIFQRQDFIDDIFVIHKEEIKGLAKNSHQQSINSALEYLQKDLAPVLSQEWDWVINLSFSIPSAILAFLAHGKKNSGFFATNNREYISKDKWFYYTLSSFPNRKYSLFNWVDINSNIVKTHNIPKYLCFPLNREEDSWADNILQGFYSQKDELVGFHPGASGPHKMWPVDNFISLANSLIDRNKKIVIFGDKSEQKLGKKIKDATGKNVLNLTGLATLSQTAAVMSRCSLLVCNDSGPMHLASAVGTPVLALFFSTHFVETGPYGENNLVLHPIIDCFPCHGTVSCSHKKCLDSIPVEAVLRLIDNRHKIMIRSKDAPLGFPDNVAANRARFDSMGFLEWVPAFKRPLTIDNLVWLILKLSYIPCLTGRKIHEYDRISYVRRFLGFFSLIDKPEFKTPLNNLLSTIRDLEFSIIEIIDICTELYNKSYDLKGNSESIVKMGKKLQKKEDSLLKNTSRYLDIIIKYIEMARNNIDERDFQKLAALNINVYRDAADLVGELKDNTNLVSRLIEEIPG